MRNGLFPLSNFAKLTQMRRRQVCPDDFAIRFFGFNPGKIICLVHLPTSAKDRKSARKHLLTVPGVSSPSIDRCSVCGHSGARPPTVATT
jgi:hypothetical protein